MGAREKRYWTAEAPRSHTENLLKIRVTGGDGSVSEAVRGSVERRVLLALSRFGPRLEKVTVRLAEPENPLGGIDQRCRMRAWLVPPTDIRAEAINGTIDAVVSRAAAQLAKRVALVLDGHGPPKVLMPARRAREKSKRQP
jgi:sigma 54 modulation/S30EA-like ribosomal protein